MPAQYVQDGPEHVNVTFSCPHGHKDITVRITLKQFFEIQSPNRRHIQDILSDHSPDERELFISGTCPECWDIMFKEKDDE
jgi:hypothetical protein